VIFWIIALGLVAMALKANWGSVTTMTSSGVTILGRLAGFDPSRLKYPGANEEQDILVASAHAGVDARFIAAIRLAENGGPGHQYGVLNIGANTLDAQLQGAVNTIKHFLSAYVIDSGVEPVGGDGRYTPDFIDYVANGGPSHGGWAPIGASNDPNHLNENWLSNVMTNYYSTDLV